MRTQTHRLVREIKGPTGGSKAKASDGSATAWQLYDMESDPGQAKDIAKQNPELVAKLSQLYDEWFADISSAGLRRFPIPVGYEEENPVQLHAPQAYFTGALRFANGPGFANDWLTGWTNVADKVWFEIEVVQAGNYDVELAYLCPKEDAGAQIRVGSGRASVEGVVAGTPIRMVPLPHRDEEGRKSYVNMEWATLRLGKLALEKGQNKLSIEVVSKPGAQVMELERSSQQSTKPVVAQCQGTP